LGDVATYYTRPMSNGWSSLRDIELAADGNVEFDYSIPLAEFGRLAPQLASVAGQARTRARFARELGFPVVDLEVNTDLLLTCQRCLRGMPWPVATRARVALVEDLASADGLPEGLESIVVEGGRTSMRELAEEELLLALPLVALHENLGECRAAGVETQQAAAGDSAETDRTQKPFAQLAELLKRGR
jgi:uncharacterized protein